MFRITSKYNKANKIKNQYDLVSDKQKITFFTGAGISKESGLDTFRDSDGLWNNYRIEDVATARAIKKDFNTVIDFYNMRRIEMLNALPNNAHNLIKKLENYYDIAIITQNIDNLHEMAGSSNIIHLHGEIFKSRPVSNTKILYDQYEDIKPDERCPKTNSKLRPNVVLFNENLDEDNYNIAKKHIRQSDIVVVIGTSLQVNPAAHLVTEANSKAKLYVINPDENINQTYYKNFYSEITHLNKVATEGMEILYSILEPK